MAVVALMATAVAACGGGSSDATLRGLVREQPLSVADVTVVEVDADGVERPLALRADPGELLVVYFGYTACPDLCPTTLADLRSARRRLPEPASERIDLAMITVDPERDRPSVLVGYLSGFADRFHAVRMTDPAALARAQDALLAASSVTVADDGTVEVAHTTVTYVVDQNGTVLVEWPFAAGADTMAHDLAVLTDALDRAERS